MTNLERFIRHDNVTTEGYLCAIAHTIKEGHCCNNCCVGCKYKIKKIVLDILLSEYIEPIKLKQWEYDLIGYTYRTSYKKMYFEYYAELNYLKGIGHFKGISDTGMELSEILENCEVVE